MNESEAQTMVAMLAAAWPNQWVGPATAEIYTRQMLRLGSPEAAYEAVELLINGERKLPSFALIRENYDAVLRRPDFQRKMLAEQDNSIFDGFEDVCAYCEGNGLVELRGTEVTKKIGGREFTYLAEQAPCPHCALGRVVEFNGRWGPDGFWQGREARKSELLPHLASEPLPIEENAERARALLGRIGGGVGKEMS